MRLLISALSAVALLVGIGVSPATANGQGIHYGMMAPQVAKKLDCRGATRPDQSGGDPRFHIKDGVVCLLKLKRVNVITFKDKAGQTRWEDYMVNLARAQGYPENWSSADGVTIVARNGNAAAACAGFRALRGARHVGAYVATARGIRYLDC